MSIAEIRREFKHLSTEDKIRLLHELWDEIEPSAQELTNSQAAELRARHQRYEQDPARTLTWEEVEARYQRSK